MLIQVLHQAKKSRLNFLGALDSINNSSGKNKHVDRGRNKSFSRKPNAHITECVMSHAVMFQPPRLCCGRLPVVTSVGTNTHIFRRNAQLHWLHLMLFTLSGWLLPPLEGTNLYTCSLVSCTTTASTHEVAGAANPAMDVPWLK